MIDLGSHQLLSLGMAITEPYQTIEMTKDLLVVGQNCLNQISTPDRHGADRAFQAPEEGRRPATQPTLDIGQTETPDAVQWPRDDPARQFIVLRNVLTRCVAPTAANELARQVKGAPRGGKIGEMLKVLVAVNIPVLPSVCCLPVNYRC
jgi:hypothetical protein